MSISGIAEWFRALPLFTQIFFGLFLVLVALPIVTLTVFQFFESLRILRGNAEARRERDKENKE